MKILKYVLLFLLLALVGIVGYIYSLTFTPNGRLNWGQALFLKLIENQNTPIEKLSKMSVAERGDLLDAFPINTAGFKIDTIKITSDSLTTYIFKPQNISANAPVVVYFHGGAFILPWTNLSSSYSTRLSRSFKAIVVAVDYRVAPEFPFPTPNNDCYATFLWTIENIAKWGGNPNQIILAGESAGGTLAATVAFKAKQNQLTNIKYQILECPAGYIPFKTEAFEKFKNGYFLLGSEIEYAIESYLPNSADYNNPAVFPYYSDSLMNLPPAFVITCEFDPLKDTGSDYAEKLKKANVPTTYLEMKGMIHNLQGHFNESDRENLYQQVAKDAAKYLQ